MGQTLSAVVPPGALSTNATVTLNLFTQTGLPRAFASGKRSAQNVPTGATFVAGFTISIGGATLTVPIKVSITAAAPPAGSVARLAGSLPTATNFSDVDTATFANGTVTDDVNPAYADLTDPAGTLYAYYYVPQASANPPPTFAVTVAGSSVVQTGAAQTYTASEADNAGFPVITATFAYSVDNAALGTIAPTSGVLTGGAVGGTGNVIATDTASGHTGRSGTLAVKSQSQRPAGPNDTASYTGTLTHSIVRNNVTGTFTEAANVALTATSAAGANSGQYTITGVESDTYPLQTTQTNSTASVAYQTSGASTNVRLTKTVNTDSSGATYETDYGSNNGLVTVLPETAGSFSNDAASTYTETDPSLSAAGGNVSTTRVTASAGTSSTVTLNADGSETTATVNADGTGYVDDVDFEQYTFGLPVAASGGNPAYIPVTRCLVNVGANHTVTCAPNAMGGNPLSNLSSYPWYGLNPVTTPIVETDTITPGATLDPSCSTTASSFGGPPTLVQQTIVTTDTAFGNAETLTTKTYDVYGVGTVCVTISDTVNTWYDFTVQAGHRLSVISPTAVNPVPLETTTLTETLSLASATVAGQSVRGTASRSIAALPSVAALANIARARFQHQLSIDRLTRTFNPAGTRL